ncbi:MAG: hypothetical protein KJZ80_05965 [Hyphomicrobiaceae bacterium]|nr:hypothetical protein [Hyphomicrobiaceae bacterium]
MSLHPADTLALDSVTHIMPEHRGRVAYCASHGGRYSGAWAASMGLAAAVLNDAGIGREQAGLGGAVLLAELGVPAATVSHRSARIGDGADGLARGTLSFVNGLAADLGLAAGMPCREALRRLAAAGLSPAPKPPVDEEHRHELTEAGRAGVKVVVLDSVSLVQPEDAGHIVVTASHGGLLGGRPETAVKVPAFAAVYNDADRGIDEAGISRLPALDVRRIAGACVQAFSARIGDGASTWNDGFISALNETAARHGGRIGQSCRDFVAAMVEARVRERES